MKICAIICEFNPFHNGHRYLIEQAKRLSGCDKILCVISGSYTQRGDLCVADRFIRAKHAILGGADAVLELPVSFTVAPAEIFAEGAVKILGSVHDVKVLAFGCENEAIDFDSSARTATESDEFKNILRKNLAEGQSYIRSYGAAFAATGGNDEVVSKPNNILGFEYAKAIIKLKKNIKILPVRRVGGDYNDGFLTGQYSSSRAIRQNRGNPLIKSAMPDFVFNDINNLQDNTPSFELFMRGKLVESAPETIKKIMGCTEGLENSIKRYEMLPIAEIIENTTSKRYSSSRIKRILLANMLGLYTEDCRAFLENKLYLKPLAIKKDDELLSSLAQAEYPLLLKKRNLADLDEIAAKCYELDRKADKIADFLNGVNSEDFDYPLFL